MSGCESTVLVLVSPTNGAMIGRISELVLLVDDNAPSNVVASTSSALTTSSASPSDVRVTLTPGASVSFTVSVTAPLLVFPAPQRLLEVVLLLDQSSSAQVRGAGPLPSLACRCARSSSSSSSSSSSQQL